MKKFLMVLLGSLFLSLVANADAFSCEGKKGWGAYYNRVSKIFKVYQHREMYDLQDVFEKNNEVNGSYSKNDRNYFAKMNIPSNLEDNESFETELLITEIWLNIGGTIANDPNHTSEPRTIPFTCRAMVDPGERLIVQ